MLEKDYYRDCDLYVERLDIKNCRYVIIINKVDNVFDLKSVIIDKKNLEGRDQRTVIENMNKVFIEVKDISDEDC